MKSKSLYWCALLALTASACGAQEQIASEEQVILSEASSSLVCCNCGPDTTPPKSVATILATPDANGVYHGDVVIRLTATDDCSGIRSVAYYLSGASNESGYMFGSSLEFRIEHPGTTTITYGSVDGSRNSEPANKLTLTVAPACSQIDLNDANVFVLRDYTGGHTVGGKVAAGGTIDLADFGVGGQLPATDTSNVLVAGANLNIARGAVFGDAYYGTSTTADPSTTFYRGALAQGSPINFSSRFNGFYDLVMDLHANPNVNGTTRLEPWGGVFLEGTDPQFNSFKVSASAFSNAVYRSISAPAGSVVMVTLEDAIGSTLTLANSSITYQGVDPHNVLFFPWGPTTLNMSNFVLQGTLFAPWTDVQFNNGRFEGGIYARSLSGNAEGHLHPLPAFTFCGVRPH
jgi:choice-of-anchor A domain-containing protein